MGIIDGSADDMAGAIARAHASGKAILGMKPLAGGNLLEEREAALDFVLANDNLDAIATGRYAEYATDLYENLEYNGRRVPDLLITGGKVAVPGLPVLQADILVNFDRPLLREEGVIADIGDLGESQAQDTLDVTGLFVIPEEEALDGTGGLNTGAPASFTVAEDPEGRRVRFRFLGGPPKRSP